jgi:PAS domain S-box-containing protein
MVLTPMFNPILIARLDVLVKIFATLAILTGTVVMLGWLFQTPILTSLVPNYASMKFNSALSINLLGFALIGKNRPRLSQVLAASGGLIGFLSLVQYLFGWELGIDEFFVADMQNWAELYPGRMSPITALLFFLLGMSLLLSLQAHFLMLAQTISLSVIFLAVLALAGYLFGVQSLYKISAFSSVAWHTALSFVVLGMATFLLHPEKGFASWIFENRAGGIMARRWLPIVIIVPLVLAWLRFQGEELGLYDTAFGISLLAMSNLFLLTALVFWTAHSLNQVDRERGDAMQALSLLVNELEERVQARTQELERTMQEEHELQSYLKKLHDISIELSNLQHLDTFYKRAVELGIEGFGFERLGLLRFDPKDEAALGTYGTDRHGKLISEDSLRFNPSDLTNILYRAFHHNERFALDMDAELFDNYEAIGRGQNAAAVLWNGAERLGWLAIDNAVHRKAITKPQLDILALYALTLGNLLAQKQAQFALEESEQRYRSVMNALSEGIVLSSSDGKVQALNEAAIRISGLSDEQMMGKVAFDPEWYMVDEDGNAIAREDRPSEVSLRTGIAYSNLVMAVHKPDKSLTWVLINTEPMFREGETLPYAVVLSFTDISQQKLAQKQAFEIALEKERTNLLNQFIQNSSHEFRTPITIMKTNLYIIGKTDDSVKRQEKLKTIEEQISRLTKLIDTMLHLNRLDIGESFYFSQQNINSLIQDLCNDVQNQLDAKNITLDLELTEALPTIKLDSSQMFRAMREIVDNAIRFSPPKSHIKIRSILETEQVKVLIEDDGPGISPEMLPHVFERFYRQDSAHSTPGFGLGLSIAQAIVHRHRGEIFVESRLGKGTVFAIVLPINL